MNRSLSTNIAHTIVHLTEHALASRRLLERRETRVHEAHDEAQESGAFVHLIHFCEDFIRQGWVLNLAQARAIDVPDAGLSYISQTVLRAAIVPKPEIEREENVQETLHTTDPARIQHQSESD